MKKFTLTDYFKGYDLNKISQEHKNNAQNLLDKVNTLLEAFNKECFISSGYRSMEKHLNIYKIKNEERAKQGLPALNIPTSSRHLTALAIDIGDSDNKLKHFILANMHLAEILDIYFEEFKYTPTWVHIQLVPPKSKKRFFIP